ncbi:methyltransferase [Streptomyces cavernicola]|uniref:Methyltransferase n=1 Tax=Streptomyces cavernicola TaxID=3043613 RepID=A0ABT6SQB3_9ACTN|nr:methyltransferase [Streptomyces sp. B-S-A6]MDI3409421.1 methyltransferase [Streptomyces sp. B-S-A6]
MTTDTTLARLREYMVGPTRFVNLLSCFELGIIDKIRESPGITVAQLADAVNASRDSVAQLLSLPVHEGFVSYDDEQGGYSLGTLADLESEDLQRVLAFMDLIKVTVLRQSFYLTESVRAGSVVGLKEFYGYEGTLFGAVAEHKDLRESWATAMDSETARIDPWFFKNIDVPAGAKVLDLAGNTGLGAIHTYKLNEQPGLKVTTFDLPEKEEECLENFRKHGVAEHCSFIGGDVFESVPRGFDVVLIKHFLALWDSDQAAAIIRGVGKALETGGKLNLLIPLYPENNQDTTDPRCVDFYPAFFLGCAMGQGGGLKLSAYRTMLQEHGFEITNVQVEDPADMPADSFPIHAIVSATKVKNTAA